MLVSNLDHLEVVNENTGILGGIRMSCPYTTTGVTSRLRIRSGPSTSYRIVGYWYPGDVKYLESRGGLEKNGFRALDSSKDEWVSRQYIRPTGGHCLPID